MSNASNTKATETKTSPRAAYIAASSAATMAHSAIQLSDTKANWTAYDLACAAQASAARAFLRSEGVHYA